VNESVKVQDTRIRKSQDQPKHKGFHICIGKDPVVGHFDYLHDFKPVFVEKFTVMKFIFFK